MLQLFDPVSKVFLVGPSMARRLEKLGIFTVKDLLYHIPARYDDYSLVSKMANVQAGETVTIKGLVLEMKNVFTRSGFILQQAKVQDETGALEIVWFNQKFLTRVIKKGDAISLSGKIDEKKKMVSPQYEIGSSIHTGRLVPVYPETEGISSKWLRSRISWLLKNVDLKEYLDYAKENIMEISLAVSKIHFPDNLDQAQKAKYRLAFDELLISALEAKLRKADLIKQKVAKVFTNFNVKLDLNFDLTGSQKIVIEEIFADLRKDTPMNRLLQGDVGSGKTVVAAYAILAANLNGLKTAFMAPTEILANQHYETLKKLGLDVGLITAYKKIGLNSKNIVGTHAILFNKNEYGLIVIDEQHRFGVSQRAALAAKGINPHVLTMTATPIPRTIALTLYGDLDLSTITEMPKNRLPVKTWVVPSNKRDAAYEWIKKQNTQCFIICPLIEESESLQSVKAATTEFENIKKIFGDFNVGLIHGRMKNKDTVLEKFRKGKLDILVATPVVEVGIDVPSATIMVIEGAERFGLAQLHQLRGRVGRSEKQSYCLLFSEGNAQRLKYLEKINNGMELSEIDLKFRGPGQRFGAQQHGPWDLKIADFSDLDLIEKTNQVAQKILANLNAFPVLQENLNKSKIRIASN